MAIDSLDLNKKVSEIILQVIFQPILNHPKKLIKLKA